ncbi:MAG TPA: 2-oxo-4-hydroxy-4-carboxy-5-ureidoimidazoline decarboxylase [Blastocatellia bacterium]|nr:2-oxo-4-hydroxy-4-carboxy-5-ureidoimidazoline decarboxylase [Blastocatellia bacterium]
MGETGIQRLNAASREEAFADLLACCGSIKWAQRMTDLRPYADWASIREAAERLWWELRPDDWLEAFASHPKIGERQAERNRSTQSAAWSAGEQSGIRDATEETLAALAEANRTYQDRFGYIFIICATGKQTAEMLAQCRQRLSNDPETEFRIAAAEQHQITEIRLKKLIEETQSVVNQIG